MIALLAAASIVGGHVYSARIDAGGATVMLWRYAAAGERQGPPVLLLPELGYDRSLFDPGLARALQARGREVFVLEWRKTTGVLGGLDALFGGDAPAALDAALEATGAPCAQVVGVGLGGTAAWFLPRACALVLVSVPARYEVPNEAVRRLIAQGRKVAGPIDLRAWGEVPAPFGKRDLASLLLGAGPRPTGKLAPELMADLGRWMLAGDLVLGAGPLLPAAKLSDAVRGVRVPILEVVAPADNLVHPEHALALEAPHELIVLSRIEGYSADAGHLAIAAPWAARELFPRIAEWLAEKK